MQCGAGASSLASRRFLEVAAAKCMTRKPLLIESAPRPAGDRAMLVGAFEQARIVRGLDVTADPASRRPRMTEISPRQSQSATTPSESRGVLATVTNGVIE